MDNINLDELFNIIENNINDNIFIDNIIEYIEQNFDNIEYNIFIKKIISKIDDCKFILKLLNPLINKLNVYRKIILYDLILNIDEINILKNLYLLDYFGFENLYNIFRYKKFSINDNVELLNWLYIYNKNDILYDLIKYQYKPKNNIDTFILIVLSVIELYNKYNHLELIKFIDKLLSEVIYPMTEINNIIIETLNVEIESIMKLFKNEANTNIIYNYYINLYEKNILNNNEIEDILIFINIINKINQTNILIDNLLNRLKFFLINDKLNIHEKTSLFIKLCKFIINEKQKYIPYNFIFYINHYLSNVKFLEWSNLDEQINIFLFISKILLKLYQFNQIDFNQIDFNQSEQLLYNLIYYEGEIFKLLENIYKSNTTFINYTLIKESLYGLINVLNIFSEIENHILNILLNNNVDKKEYDYIFYKSNLNLSYYILYLKKTEDTYRFNLNIMINNFIITKLIFLYKLMDTNNVYYYGLEYDLIKEYYNKNFIKISDEFIILLDEYKKILDEYNKFIDDNLESDLIDTIFSIKIINPYKLPKSNDLYERCTLRLLIKESEKHPLTRESLSLEELDEFNMNLI
jgi:hypothetical protein